MNRHCHNCGKEWELDGQPGRSESCHGCNEDLRVCLNCVFHDRSVAYQCRERRAEPVTEKKPVQLLRVLRLRIARLEREQWHKQEGGGSQGHVRPVVRELKRAALPGFPPADSNSCQACFKVDCKKKMKMLLSEIAATSTVAALQPITALATHEKNRRNHQALQA